MASERVIRAYIGPDELEDVEKGKWGIVDSTQEKGDDLPITILLDGPDGSRGGLEPWMVEFLEIVNMFHRGTAVKTLKILWDPGDMHKIAAAIAKILEE